MEEIYVKIEDYPNYEVSNLGNVRRIRDGHQMYKEKSKAGYLRVGLSKNGKYTHLLVHRLVAKAFIPNENNYPQVNHIDENKENNRVDNLEWCTASYNARYGSCYKSKFVRNPGWDNLVPKKVVPIICIETGEVHGGREWKLLGYSNACSVAKGKIPHCKHLHFRYV